MTGTLAGLFREPDFWPTIGTTLLRLALGLGIGVAVGTVLGLLFGLCPKLEDVGMPFIHVLQSVPPGCWVVLALVVKNLFSVDGSMYSLWRHPPFQRW